MENITVVSRYVKPGSAYIRVRLSDGRVLSEQRFIMEQQLGRRLTRAEHVHHKDLDKRHNEISNLEIKTPAEHTKLHCKPAEMVQLTCAVCHLNFQRTARYVRSKLSGGQRLFLCDRSCRPQRGAGSKALPHGTRTGYQYWHCRCSMCRQAQTEYMQRFRGSGP